MHLQRSVKRLAKKLARRFPRRHAIGDSPRHQYPVPPASIGEIQRRQQRNIREDERKADYRERRIN